MVKIVVTQPMDMYPDHIERLRSLGDVTIYDDMPKDHEDWLNRVKDTKIICSGKFGLKQKYQELHDVMISVPFVGVGWVDRDILKKNNISFAISPGCNKDAVSEYMIAMMLNLLRRLTKFIDATDLPEGEFPERSKSMNGKKVCVLGKGNIGSRVGKLCEAFDMVVKYFDREDDLMESVKDADVIFNCLSRNPTTEGLLDKNFFSSLKKDSYFISVTSPKIYDSDAMLESLENGMFAGAGIDAGDAQCGDVSDPFYQKLLKNPKVLATPHIAFHTDFTARVGNDMMIDNIEAWIKGKPINLI